MIGIARRPAVGCHANPCARRSGAPVFHSHFYKRVPFAGLSVPLLMLAGLLAIGHPAQAGPVPGVDSIARTPVDFPTPPSIVAWLTADGDYLVTFRHETTERPRQLGVAGSFNGWDPADLPMDPPSGEEPAWTVTARLPAGVYTYKFVADGRWLQDTANPQGESDGHGGQNSVLKLGIFAKHENLRAERGDGEVVAETFLHDPAAHLYFDAVDDDTVLVRFRTLRNDVESVEWVLMLDEETRRPMAHAGADDAYDYWERAVTLAPEKLGATYTFVAHDGGEQFPHARQYELAEPQQRVDTPEWARDAIWYQIMIERFRDGNPMNNAEHLNDPKRSSITHPWTSSWYEELPHEREDGATFWRWSMYNRLYGGDFAGVIEKLDYIKSLGINAIYFNPVFEAHSPHKYNARNYVHADDSYGVAGEYPKTAAQEDLLDASTWTFNESDKLLLRLIQECHARGIRVIFDGVFNHVGDDHPAFLDVKEKGRDSRYADWFTVRSWEPFEYAGWAGFGGLPEFAKTPTGLVSESLTRHIYDVTRRWMDPNGDGDPSDGIDGWRLDVPNELPKQFWVEWREHVKSINPDAYIVGEIWDPAEHWLDGTTFDAVMNYEFARAAFHWFGNVKRKITATEFDRRLARLRLRYPAAHTYVLQNLFDSHDTDRWVSRLANPDLDYDQENRIQDTGPNFFDKRPDPMHYQRLKLMALFQATYVGAPMIYYGTEVSMFGADDPHNRMPMWWEHLMPYDNPEYRIDEGLREEFRRLFQLRHQRTELRRGRFTTAIADDENDVYGYFRHLPGAPEAVLVLLNNSASPQRVVIPGGHAGLAPDTFRGFHQLHGEAGIRAVERGRALAVELPPVAGTAILIRRDSAR